MTTKRRHELAPPTRKIEQTERSVMRTDDVPTHFEGTIIDALDAAGLTGPSWRPWRTFWKAAFALKLTNDDLAFFAKQTRPHVAARLSGQGGFAIRRGVTYAFIRPWLLVKRS